MRKLYICPYCKSWNIYLSSYEDGGGDFGDDVTGIYECSDCGASSSEDEALWGWEIDDNSGSGNPDLDEISGGYN